MDYVMDEFGFFSESDMRKLKRKMDGKSYMNFRVGCSNYAGNYTLIVKTDYFQGDDTLYEEQKKAVMGTFVHYLITDI